VAQGKAPTGIRHRIKRWALRRQGNDLLPLTMAGRRIYILPTRAGWIFAMLIVVMFIAGMNYGNGLALLFTFWLTAFALVAMVQTQRNLSGTRLLDAAAEPAFVGEAVALRVQVSTLGAAADLALYSEDQAPSSPDHRSDTADSTLQLSLLAERRGPWRAPVLQLASTAPFGLFRSWTWLTLDVRTLIYPQLAGPLPVPVSPGEDAGSGLMVNSQDELAWLRDFREGDSPRQVAWKAYARGAPLLVREYRGHAAANRDFDFSALQGMDTEVRLSQLARWCVDAAARGERWTLRLPETSPLSGAGADHLTQCLQQLALHGIQGDAA
jgi:uncharacterized protein (DUF58 family)